MENGKKTLTAEDVYAKMDELGELAEDVAKLDAKRYHLESSDAPYRNMRFSRFEMACILLTIENTIK